MKSLKKNWWKAIIIIFTCVVIDLILHALIAPINESNTSVFQPSIFVRNGLLIPAVSVYALIDFSILAVSFLLIQKHLSGKRWLKGFLYGFSFGGLYFIGMFEGILLWDDTITNSILMGLADFVPILIMGTLLGIFTGTEEVVSKRKQNVLFIFVIAILFVIGRYFSYSILHIGSAYINKAFGTFIWTLFEGLSVGVIFYIMELDISGNTPVCGGIFLGAVIFAVNWLMYHLFIAIIAEVSFADIFTRVGIDSLFSVFGIFIWRKLLTTKDKVTEISIE